MDYIGTSCLNEVNFETYSNILEILKSEKSCAVVQPTGTGKSYIMMELLKTFYDSWKIVIAPSRMFLNNLEQNKYWISNKTLTITYSQAGLNCDDMISVIAEYGINPDSVGLIILDEMHRAGAPKWGAGAQNLIALCKNAKTVGFTATPKRYDEDRDMVQELFNGRTARNINLAEAVRLKMVPLLNYTVSMHDVEINITELKSKVSKDKHMEYILDMLNKYNEKWDFTNCFVSTLNKYIDTSVVGGKHIVFASNIEEAEKMVPVVKTCFKKLYNTNNVKVYCIHSKEAKRAEYIEQFFDNNTPGEVKVALSVNMLNESFHCKDIKTISMFRGTQSVSVYMQQIGRAITLDGDVPYIFDFVDNYHTIDNLHEMLTIDSLMEIEEMQDTTSFVFNEFNDETSSFVSDMHKIKLLINMDTTAILKELSRRLKESDDGTIFSVKDEKFVYWASYVIKDIYLGRSERDEYSDLLISFDINRAFGYEWYKLCRRYLDNKESLNEKEQKHLRSEFNKSFLLNAMNKSTVNFFKDRGLASTITVNEVKLRGILSKHEPKQFKFKEEIIFINDAIENIDNINSFELYRAVTRVESYMNDMQQRNWSYDMVGDAAAFWLWSIYKEKYKTEFNAVKNEYDSYECLEKILNKTRRYRYNLGIDVVKEVNAIIKDVNTLDDLPEAARNIAKYYRINSIDQICNFMYKQLYLTVDEENFMNRVRGQGRYVHIDDRLKDYVKNIKKSAYDHLCKYDVDWHNYIVDRYNRLCDDCDTIINTDKTEIDSIKLTNYLAVSVSKSRSERRKKPENTYNYYSNHARLLRILNEFSDVDKVKSELCNEYLDDFDSKYTEALTEWGKHRYYDKLDNFFVCMIALSNSKVCNNNNSVNQVKQKLQRNLIIVFEIMEDIDNETIQDDTLEKLRLTLQIIGNNIWYLICSTLSKKTRETGLLMYKQYKITGKILSKTAMSFFDNDAGSDNKVIHYITVSRYLKTIGNLDKFFNTMIESYENLAD